MTITSALPRIYYPVPLAIHETILLEGNAHQHLVQALRMRINDSVILFNSNNEEYLGEIAEINKRSSSITLSEKYNISRESPVKIHLGQVLARGEKMDWIIQKATELGVTEITPLFSERCNVKLDNEKFDKKLAHWNKIAISACEQSGRNRLPTVNTVIALKEWIKQTQAEMRLCLHPHTEIKPWPDVSPQSISILIGPEGGFSEEEASFAKQQNFHLLNLGPRILRTETAGLSILSILQMKYGDFSS